LFSKPCWIFPQPCWMFPQPCWMFPQPCWLFSKPCWMFPKPCWMFPKPCSMFPQPCWMFPKPTAECSLNRVECFLNPYSSRTFLETSLASWQRSLRMTGPLLFCGRISMPLGSRCRHVRTTKWVKELLDPVVSDDANTVVDSFQKRILHSIYILWAKDYLKLAEKACHASATLHTVSVSCCLSLYIWASFL
jgi:hypothetical protein